MAGDLRCPRCGRLLGKQQEGGAVELRHRGELLIRAATPATLRCARDGFEVTVDGESRAARIG